MYVWYTIYFSQFSLQLSELLARNERQLAKRFLLCQYLCQVPRYLCDSIVYYLLAWGAREWVYQWQTLDTTLPGGFLAWSCHVGLAKVFGVHFALAPRPKMGQDGPHKTETSANSCPSHSLAGKHNYIVAYSQLDMPRLGNAQCASQRASFWRLISAIIARSALICEHPTVLTPPSIFIQPFNT